MVISKRGNYFVSRGNCRKSAWRSLHWVNYHIGRNMQDYKILTVNTDGTTQMNEATELLSSLPANLKQTEAEVFRNVGVKMNLETLKACVTANILTTEVRVKAIEYLQRKGITL
jgi:hypothetical protein